MIKKKLYWQIPFLIILIVGSIWIVRCQRSMPYQHNTGMIFGTVYHITYQYNEDLQPAIEAELQKVNMTFSTFEKNSLISQINQNKPVKVNDMFAVSSISLKRCRKRPMAPLILPLLQWLICGDSGLKRGNIHQRKRLINYAE